jgi:folylpolyglutamate synthase/dihydropteroate synthase
MTVVTGALPPEARAVIGRTAAERGARVVEAPPACIVDVGAALTAAPSCTVRTPAARTAPSTLALRGEHQIGNALVAVRLLEAARSAGVHVSREAVESGLHGRRLAGRLEPIELPDGAVGAARRGAQP